MGEHFRPHNVVHGRFGQVGGARLSADDYRALSDRERRELLARRAHERQFRAKAPRYRKGHHARQRLTWGLLLFGGMGLFQLVDALPMFRSPGALADSVAPSSIGGRFSACKWGGGTNCVVDGDTIFLGGTKIRIAVIDAPETHDYGCPSELDLGEQAASRLQALLNSGGQVTLSSIDRDEDVYGRKLRNVAVGGADVGETLIGEGLARAYGDGRQSWCA